MHRQTAKLLLLFALVGNITPLMLAAVAAPLHACCARKAAKHCHESAASEQNQPSIRASGCCGHDCCRAATKTKWAHPQPRVDDPSRKNVSSLIARLTPDSPSIDVSEFQSS